MISVGALLGRFLIHNSTYLAVNIGTGTRKLNVVSKQGLHILGTRLY